MNPRPYGDRVVAPIHHIGYWVEDLDVAAAELAEATGAGPFLALRHVAFETFTFQGAPARLDHSAAFGMWGPIIVELDQLHDVDPPALRDALDPRPGSIGHVSWIVPSLATERLRLARLGFHELTEAHVGPVHAVWFDGGGRFDHPVEVHQDNAAIRDLYRRVAECAERWDGSDPLRDVSP